jgi:hypothetical protein
MDMNRRDGEVGGIGDEEMGKERSSTMRVMREGGELTSCVARRNPST